MRNELNELADDYTDNVVRRDEFTAAHPGTVIEYDETADRRWPWTGALPGQDEPFRRGSLGDILDALEQAAAEHARGRDLQRLKDAWGDVCDYIECESVAATGAEVWRTRLRDSTREMTRPSGPEMDEAIRGAVESGVSQ